ncbi:MAG TPA: 3-keto-5-aminohexanoate cleavage protein [Actinomycetota bacterium]|nr:3-keto-5-aminohexanoate cleavage protein [Actinomycetota bacterium]
MDPLIITVAGIGAELTTEQQPNLPISPQEVAEDAARCAEAGASIYHLHVRDDDGRPTMDVQRFAAVRDAIANRTDVVVQFTTGGALGDSDEARMAPLDLRPEMASLTTGSVNFGDEVFWNPATLVRALYTRMRELGVLPEFEIFEAGMIANALALESDSGWDHHLHFDFVLGVPGGMPAWPEAIDFLADHLPKGATWSATGIGRGHLPVAEKAISLGGHVRTGLEDVRYFEPGRLVDSNLQLVERVVSLSEKQGREIATAAEARSILGIS